MIKITIEEDGFKKELEGTLASGFVINKKDDDDCSCSMFTRGKSSNRELFSAIGAHAGNLIKRRSKGDAEKQHALLLLVTGAIFEQLEE